MGIFLSYASERFGDARAIADNLVSKGHKVWLDKNELAVGEWDPQLIEAQEKAGLIIHLCSPEILARRGVVNREIRRSLELYNDEPLGSALILPMRLVEMRLPRELARFQQVDYFRPDWRDRLGLAVAQRENQLGKSYLIPPSEHVEVQNPGDFRLVQLTDSSDSYECLGTYIEYLKDAPYWWMINAHVASFVLDDYLRYRAVLRSLPSREFEKYSWELTCEEFYRRGEVVSIRFSQYSDTGGVHGNRTISTLNFFADEPMSMERSRVDLEVRQLVRDDYEAAQALFTMCRAQVLAYYADDVPVDLGQYNQPGGGRWEVLEAFNVDSSGITFNFSPYDLLPYAYGSCEVTLRWDSVSALLTDQGHMLMEILVSSD